MMLPFERNLRFVGRQNELRHLENMMSLADGPRKIAIAGLGGVGKTQIALELAYRMRDNEPDCSIFWIACTSYEAVEQASLTIAEMLGIPVTKPAEVKQQLKIHFTHGHSKWLLIFDNADDTDMWTQGTDDNPPLRDFLPSNKQGHVVFTTRNRELAVDLVSSDIVDVRQLDETSGVEFLKRSLPSDLPHDQRSMIKLLEQLEFLPLAISQATAYINKKGITVSDYLVLLQEQETDVVELLSKDFMDERRYKDAQNPVAKTWLVSFNQIEQVNQLAGEYLQLMACVSPRDIPHSFLPPSSKLQMADALGLLSAYSLIAINPENQDITLHRLVHLATRNWLRKEGRYTLYITKTAERLTELYPNNKHENRQVWRAYLPHALFLLNDSTFQTERENYTDIIKNVAASMCREGRYAEAERLQTDVLEIRIRILGPKDVSTLTSMNHLVSNYMLQYKWKKAEELETEALEVRKEVLGHEHPATLMSLSNLATILYSQGRWKPAEELVSQALETQKRVLGSEHEDTLITMSHLVPLWQSQGRWEEAEELAAQVVEIRKRILGPEHPDTLTSITLLVGACQFQSKWNKAEQLELEVFEIRKRVLGPGSPDTLNSMVSLALTYHYQQRWEEAEELGLKVLEAQRQLLGLAHPGTLGSMHTLARTLKHMGKTSQAIALMQTCAQLRSEVLPSDHPDAISSLTMLNEWKESKGQTSHAPKNFSRGSAAPKFRKLRGLASLFRR
jgi:tetratricopeptide (TPR) repeat protein